MAALRQHVRLLDEHAKRAFVEHDAAYVGEVAGKLRLLVWDKPPSNRALLLGLMDDFDVNPLLEFDKPRGRVHVSLRDYLNQMACAIRVGDKLVETTHIDFIRAWAEQEGAAHEDWAHTPEFAAIREQSRQISIGGYPIGVSALRSITANVMSVATRVLEELSSKQQAAPAR